MKDTGAYRVKLVTTVPTSSEYRANVMVNNLNNVQDHRPITIFANCGISQHCPLILSNARTMKLQNKFRPPASEGTSCHSSRLDCQDR